MSGSPVVAIIDDDAAVGRATGSLVRSLGLAVRSFPSAEQFLAAPDRDEVACVITDVQMPGMSGIDLYCEMQARGTAIPFIFITAFSSRLRVCGSARATMPASCASPSTGMCWPNGSKPLAGNNRLPGGGDRGPSGMTRQAARRIITGIDL